MHGGAKVAGSPRLQGRRLLKRRLKNFMECGVAISYPQSTDKVKKDWRYCTDRARDIPVTNRVRWYRDVDESVNEVKYLSNVPLDFS